MQRASSCKVQPSPRCGMKAKFHRRSLEQSLAVLASIFSMIPFLWELLSFPEKVQIKFPPSKAQILLAQPTPSLFVVQGASGHAGCSVYCIDGNVSLFARCKRQRFAISKAPRCFFNGFSLRRIIATGLTVVCSTVQITTIRGITTDKTPRHVRRDTLGNAVSFAG